jgi:DNA-binding protein H-NS
MAKQSLSSMSVDALLKLRNDIGVVLDQKADTLRSQLRSLGQNDRGSRGSSLAGTKVAPKYRGPNGELWSGRGALPRWMAAEVKAGKKRDDFLIGKLGKKVLTKKLKARRK